MTRRRIIVHASLALVAWFTVLLLLSPPRHVCDPTGESAAIGSLRSFASAQRDYFDRTGRYGTLRELAFAGDIDESLLCSRVRNGYRFDVELMAGGKDFAVQAVPLVMTDIWGRAVAKRHFFVDSSGTVRYSETYPVGAGDRAVGE